ncbi:MAG: PHP domain-containing protein [Lachnospiraceae bacterium]|nr:PHP domain-containing protein [Lachnospiraceae bacterium]
MKTIDLHVHSSYSDGTLTPAELVQLARRTGLSAFSLTDHDTVDGIDETILAAKDTDIEIIPGIEFSTRWQHRDIHILGYFIDYQNTGFQQKLREFINARDSRNKKMCARIREYTGFPITLEKLHIRFPDSIITRAHMASWMVEEKYVQTRNIAFDKYLGDHAPCFIPKEEITPADAIGLILEYGGIPVLAHPLLYSLSRKQLYALIEELKEVGLMGIEAVYVMNKGNETTFLCAIAQKYDLLITGGSDFHGKNKPDISLGTGRFKNLTIPYSLLEDLKAART